VFAPDPDDDDEETLRKAADRPGTSTATNEHPESRAP
jgi:hypothetical protein